MLLDRLKMASTPNVQIPDDTRASGLRALVKESAAEIAKLRAALENARRDLNYIGATCSDRTNRKRVVLDAAARVDEALRTTPEQKGNGDGA